MADLVPYVIKQGDFLTKLAHKLGFDVDEVWNSAKNAELKRARKNHNALCPGDVLWVPKKRPEPRELALRTNNKFTAKVPTVRVRHNFAVDSEPLADLEYRVFGMGDVFEDVSDEKGGVDFDVPIHVGEVKLVFETGMVYRLNVGHTDPANTRTGAEQRLKQLGLLAEQDQDEVLESDSDKDFAVALRTFQRQHELEESGQLDEATVAKLEEEYGA